MNKLHAYQQKDLSKLLNKFDEAIEPLHLLYQLPTGGGKTMIFSGIAKKFLASSDKDVLILTHRYELCKQTSTVLKNMRIKCSIITSPTESIKSKSARCHIAMVETLSNRLEEGKIQLDNVGLVVIDEAHHNSFQKLIERFQTAHLIGVTATPLSSDAKFPMNKTYTELVMGENIPNLIKSGFLAKPKIIQYDVEINTLLKGTSGDFKTGSLDELYSSADMLNMLMEAYNGHCRKKKTLIFNSSIFTSKEILAKFQSANLPIKHLDGNTEDVEREKILSWFKETRGAILTSVSLLTTGFDEPGVQAVILNRATTSLTLYHQMVGRGSRITSSKKSFSIIDLGENSSRFGKWDEPVDWQYIFDHPSEYIESIQNKSSVTSPGMSADTRKRFSNSKEIFFDMQSAHRKMITENQKPINALKESIRQHAIMCVENAITINEANELAVLLDADIEHRVKIYTKCLDRVTKSYREWLEEDYKSRLLTLIRKLSYRTRAPVQVA